jgi:hypothetical protein
LSIDYIRTVLDEFHSGNEDFSASESEYGYSNHEIDDDVSEAKFVDVAVKKLIASGRCVAIMT